MNKYIVLGASEDAGNIWTYTESELHEYLAEENGITKFEDLEYPKQ